MTRVLMITGTAHAQNANAQTEQNAPAGRNVRVAMKNVYFHLADDIVVTIHTLNGELVKEQLEARYSKITSKFGLCVFVPDFNRIARHSAKGVTNGKATTTPQHPTSP